MKSTLVIRSLAVSAVALAGCVASEQTPKSTVCPSVFRCDSAAMLEEDIAAVEAPESSKPHEGVWSWEELAVRAGLRCAEMREGQLDAMVKRLKMEEDLSWKNPELRYSNRWSDDDDYSWSRKVDRDGDWNKWLESGHKNSDGHDYNYNLGIRFYIPNPFINHYVGLKGEADVRRTEAKAETDAYGVYTEVKLLCCEYLKARREADLYRTRVEIATHLKEVLNEGRENSVIKSPVDLIRSETQFHRTTMRHAELERDALHLKRTIARLAGVPFEGFELDESTLAMPDPNSLDIEALCESAFARRPDLALAMAELESADAAVGEAKAAYIPWFRFVEAGYRHVSDHGSSINRATDDVTYGGSRGHSDAASIELAVILPVFNWCGKSVKMSKKVRELADARVQALRALIREEIEAAVDHYRLASSRVDDERHEQFVKDINAQIAEYADSGATVEAEVGKSRQELVDYQILHNDLKSDQIEAFLRLESVLGGQLNP